VVKMPIILGKGRDPQHLKFTVISMAGSLDGLPKKNGALLKGRPGTESHNSGRVEGNHLVTRETTSRGGEDGEGKEAGTGGARRSGLDQENH
jgi:hypothetical protein